MNPTLKELLRPAYPALLPAYTFFHRHAVTPRNILRNSKKHLRMLEIGPGAKRLEGFETLNVVAGLDVDYVLDASKPLPFESESFDIIYASHVLEHIPWHQLYETVKEWGRVTKCGGAMEIWIPDGFKLCRLFCDLEEGVKVDSWCDGWNPKGLVKDAFTWTNGRLLYGARDDYPSWHKSVITPAFLAKLMNEAGMTDIHKMESSLVRGHDHGWINLGMRGTKK